MSLESVKVEVDKEAGASTQAFQAACPQYLVGFTDGEGCFSVSFRLLKRLKTGIECIPSFSIAQKKSKKNYTLLKNIRDYFDCGGIRYSASDDCYKYEIRSLPALKESIIPFFQKNQLLGEKAKDFYFFSEICSLMVGKQHLSKKGLIRILTLAENMNTSGKKKYQIKTLRACILKNEDLAIERR